MAEAGLQIGQRGQALHDQTIRAQVEPNHRGKFLILDVNEQEDGDGAAT
jgi:hypothetical protein